jgi:hypothetical protein
MYQCTLPYLYVNNKFVVIGFMFFLTCYTMVNAQSCTSRYSFVTYTCGCSNVNLGIIGCHVAYSNVKKHFQPTLLWGIITHLPQEDMHSQNPFGSGTIM